MKVSNVSRETTLRHATAAARGEKSTRLAGSHGLRITDGDTTDVQPVRKMNFQGANVVDLGDGQVDIIVKGTGTSLDNDSGAVFAFGAVVVADAGGLVTTTTAQDTRPVGIVQRSTDDTFPAPVIFSGFVSQINTTGSVSEDDFLETSTSAGLARSSGTTRRVGSFAQALAAGPNPSAIIWSPPDAVTSSGSGGASVGSAIAYKVITTGLYATAGATLADVDATNAAVAFTAPTSGKVIVRLTGVCSAAGANVNSYQSWGLREGSTDIAGQVAESIAVRQQAAANDGYVGASVVFFLSGISAGSHTYKWSFACSVGTGNLKASSLSPALMEVIEAP